MFKINKKDTIMMVSLLFNLKMFSPFSTVSFVDFKYIFVSWVG